MCVCVRVCVCLLGMGAGTVGVGWMEFGGKGEHCHSERVKEAIENRTVVGRFVGWLEMFIEQLIAEVRCLPGCLSLNCLGANSR